MTSWWRSTPAPSRCRGGSRWRRGRKGRSRSMIAGRWPRTWRSRHRSPNKPEVDPADVGYGDMRMAMTPNTCSPTWAQPSTDGAKDLRGLQQGRRDRRGRPGHLEDLPSLHHWTRPVQPRGDARRQADSSRPSSRGTPSRSSTSRAGPASRRFLTSTKVAHGVAISSDSQYAFVSSEGIGAAARQGGRDRPGRAGQGGNGGCRAAGQRDRVLENGEIGGSPDRWKQCRGRAMPGPLSCRGAEGDP